MIAPSRESWPTPRNWRRFATVWAADPAAARLNDAAAAIFYSPACYRARIVAMKDNEYYHARDEQNILLASLSAALGDLRIGWRFIAYEQVARDELDPRTTKALFLWARWP